jgi:hypothetical protein
MPFRSWLKGPDFCDLIGGSARLSLFARLSRRWDGDWKTSEKTELVRKGLWGDHAKVEGQVTKNFTLVPASS